MISGMSR